LVGERTWSGGGCSPPAGHDVCANGRVTTVAFGATIPVGGEPGFAPATADPG